MKFLKLSLFGLLVSLLFVQCQSDDVTVEPVDPRGKSDDVIVITQDITEDATWSAENTYILDGLISVSNNATLTIEPCVLVKVSNGANGLIIARGSKLNARGTADCPIIFTSEDDQIQSGEIVSPNLSGDDVALWSGIFVLGDAPVSARTNPVVVSLLPQNPLYEFGGANANDNSGVLGHVSIRHTGFETAPDEEPSGLVLAGVGNGTIVDNVELFANKDDGFLVVGGTVDINNVVTSFFKDDGVDCDLGYSGTIDNLIGIGATENNSALELDGGEGTDNPSYTIRNAAFKGAQDGEIYIDFQNDVNCTIENAYFFEFDEKSIVKLDDDNDATNWVSERINLINVEFNTSHLGSGNTSIEAIFGNNAFSIRPPDASVVNTPSQGADKSTFAKWTVAALTGALDDF